MVDVLEKYVPLSQRWRAGNVSLEKGVKKGAAGSFPTGWTGYR
jgi:hypothetical protein